MTGVGGSVGAAGAVWCGASGDVTGGGRDGWCCGQIQHSSSGQVQDLISGTYSHHASPQLWLLGRNKEVST